MSLPYPFLRSAQHPHPHWRAADRRKGSGGRGDVLLPQSIVGIHMRRSSAQVLCRHGKVSGKVACWTLSLAFCALLLTIHRSSLRRATQSTCHEIALMDTSFFLKHDVAKQRCRLMSSRRQRRHCPPDRLLDPTSSQQFAGHTMLLQDAVSAFRFESIAVRISHALFCLRRFLGSSQVLLHA